MTLDVNLDLGLKLDANTAALDANTRSRRMQWERAKAMTPADLHISTSAVSPTSGDLGMSLGGPDPGFYWQVRSLTVGGSAPDGGPNGTPEVYVTGLAGPLGAAHSTYTAIRDTADLKDIFTALNTAKAQAHFYGEHQFIVAANENVEVVIHGPTASTLYKVTVYLEIIRYTSAVLEYGADVAL